MTATTLKELRALAKTRGLKGYSKLGRDELLKLLGLAPGPATPADAAAVAKPVETKAATGRGASRTVKAARAPVEPAPAVPAHLERINGDEQRIESAKYAVTPPGVAFAEPAAGADLGEDIERLPALGAPTLCLLPQKPGVLHGYWHLPEGTVGAPQALRLRLARLGGDGLAVLEEVGLPASRGHWYFHVDESADLGAVYLQLGYYAADGSFVTAIDRGIARIPSLYASDRTDRLWWVSDQRFREMYLRAGGFVRGARLGWAGSIGSPPGAPAESPVRLAWPGNVSSR